MDADAINKLEDQISRSEKYVRKGEALKRLRSNPDFIQLIEQDYFKDLAAEYALFYGSSACVDSVKDETKKALIGLGQFNDYLNSISNNAQIAELTIDECNAEITKIESTEGEE